MKERGIYSIQARAKNTHGAIGEWGSLSAIMPLNKPPMVHHPLLQFLQQVLWLKQKRW
jgi:hypothetical protein